MTQCGRREAAQRSPGRRRSREDCRLSSQRSHPDNGGKAQFFFSLGFSPDQPEVLMNALRGVAGHGEVVHRTESPHGEKSVVDGWLSVHTEESRRRAVRTIWIIDAGKDAPRLVTAYPRQE